MQDHAPSAATRLGIALFATSILVPTARSQGTDPRPELEPADALERLASTAAEDEALGLGRLVPDLDLGDLSGESRKLTELLDGKKGAVLAMASTGCPLSNMLAPRIAAIEDEFRERGIAFAYVNGVDSETLPEMQKQVRDHGFDGPYLPDEDRVVARELGARTTTEVFVLDRARTLVYRGAIDDQYGVGTALSAPRQPFLREALEAVLRSEAPRVRATWPPGCLLDVPAATAGPPRQLTYYGRIARILADKCVGCHRQGGVAPFGLETVQSLRGRSSMVEAVVRDRLMPPWHGAADGPFRNGRVLTESERADLLAWLNSSRPLGQPSEAPVLPPLSQTWTIGKPDLLLSTTTVALPEDGPLQYARRIVASDLAEDRFATALEFRPAKPDTVHHALVWLLAPGERLPAPGDVPGTLELLGTFSRGDSVVRLEPGAARRIPAGSLFVVDLYALTMGRDMNTRLRLGLRFADEATEPDVLVSTLVLRPEPFDVPAGMPEIEQTASFVLNSGLRVRAITPYLRARGRAFTLTVTPPEGESFELLDAPRYDYRWQIRHELREPVDLAAGTLLRLRGRFDSTAQNPNNPAPSLPAQTGPGAFDETLLVALEIESARSAGSEGHDGRDHGAHEHGAEAHAGDAPLPAGIEEQRASYPLDTCVVGGGALDSMGGPTDFVYEGRLLLFCCEACEPIFLSDPAFYLKKLDAARDD